MYQLLPHLSVISHLSTAHYIPVSSLCCSQVHIKGRQCVLSRLLSVSNSIVQAFFVVAMLCSAKDMWQDIWLSTHVCCSLSSNIFVLCAWSILLSKCIAYSAEEHIHTKNFTMMTFNKIWCVMYMIMHGSDLLGGCRMRWVICYWVCCMRASPVPSSISSPFLHSFSILGFIDSLLWGWQRTSGPAPIPSPHCKVFGISLSTST